ncbi:lactosylceramide 1,3-N-acetyl-beta-D-glucosaminyltransferase-like [Pomacea canaliculata]|uniref:lactosylceramide 1,3-N-acetyl-beta-D-glucosaminyltransferase-like n=1 Tax=Pomacea canaliculata TaxID=400727 RepID=UPI000D7320FD|nr:lactosylceramide 1,3-N-acetyl-beta-D-glucosaminyltransferase-like [Pomacea canaliculata]
MYVEKSEDSGRNKTESQELELLLKMRLQLKELRPESKQTTRLEDFRSTTQSNGFSKSELNHSISNTSVYYRQQLDNAIKSLNFIPEDEYLRDNSSFFKLHSHVVNSFVPEVLIQASPPCPNDSPFLLVALLSVPVNSARRRAVRKTWGSIAQGKTWPRKSVSVNVRLLFFMGINSAANMSDLKAESERHGDIVLGNFQDTYRNLSLKVAFVINWTINYCTNTKNLMKVDEDTFVNVPLLIDVLQNVSRQHESYIIGFKHAPDKPPVVRVNRWKVPEDVYPLSHFPRHVIGASYVLSNEAFKKLYTAYQHMPLVPVEDAFFTGILAKTMDIRRIYSPLFASGFEGNKCLLLEDKLVSQTYNGDALNSIWSFIVDDKC